MSFQLLGQELRFDVDVLTLVYSENGTLYFSEMDHTGGRSQYNPDSANYGSRYRDAQCPVGTWINGTLNTNSHGASCNEMEYLGGKRQCYYIYTPSMPGNTCDRSGYGFNLYSLGDHTYYSNGETVDALHPFTVVLQIYTNDNTATGTPVEIRRLYIQNGQIIQNAVLPSGLDSITADWCSSSDGSATSLGGLTTISEMLGRGMVLVFSIWNDNGQFINWLDNGSSGPCTTSAGNPSTIKAHASGTYVTFPNIKWGDIGSTYCTWLVALHSQNPLLFEIMYNFGFQGSRLADTRDTPLNTTWQFQLGCAGVS